MIDQFWTFFVAIGLLTLFPGVDSLLVVRNASRGGWQDGLATSTGICCGLFIHALVSALGISALLLQSAMAFNLLKLIGGGYLIWLGLSNLWPFTSPAGPLPDPGMAVKQPGFRLRRSLREGFVCNLFNPKTLLFYMAFLPQFIDPTRSALLQVLSMATVHFALAMFYQGLLALFVAKVKVLFQRGSMRFIAEGCVGALLVFFGLRFILASRA
jgi:threonine/homoserine/homoserine lactone efflux protein